MISHEHIDHIAGLAGLLFTLDLRQGAPMDINIWGGVLVLEKIACLLQTFINLQWLRIHYNRLTSDLNQSDYQTKQKDFSPRKVKDTLGFFYEEKIQKGKTKKQTVSDLMKIASEWLQGNANKVKSDVLWDDEITCKAFRTHHTQSSFGFIFEEKGKRIFLPKEAEKLNIPKGKIWKQLENEPEVKLPDGRIIKQEMVLSPLVKGKKVVLLTDTLFNTDLISFCEGADCLIAEATYLEKDSEKAKEFKQLTATQAGILAKEAGVKNLYLNHITNRYRKVEVILNEAKKEFPGVVVAEDLQEIKV